MATSWHTGTDGVEYPEEREEVQYTERETGVDEIVVRIYQNGNYQIFDRSTKTGGEIVSYRGIAQMLLPEGLREQYGPDARWVWMSQFWDGYFKTEELLVLYIYE